MLVVFTFVFYFLLTRVLSIFIIDKYLNYHSKLTNANAASLSSFMEDFGVSVAYLGRLTSMENMGSSAAADIRAFSDQWGSGDLVGEILLVNDKGVVQFSSSVNGEASIGQSKSSSEYFIWARERKIEGEYFFGRLYKEDVGKDKGIDIVPVASPVFRDGVFVGAVVAHINLENVAKHYLGLLTLTRGTEVYLIGDNGRVIYATSGEHGLGFHYDSDSIRKMGVGMVDGKLVSSTTLSSGKNFWFVVAATPQDDVLKGAIAKDVQNIAPLLFASMTFVTFLIFSKL